MTITPGNRPCAPAPGAPTSFVMEVRLPDGSGSVHIDCQYTWDGTSTPAVGCDGPVTSFRTRNTGTSPAWAMLPDKKRPPLWVKIDPGTDVTVNAQGQLNNLGLSNAQDLFSVRFQFTDPA